MSKDRSLKPKVIRKARTCPGQWRASKRKRENKQRKEVVSMEEAQQRYRDVAPVERGITREYHSSQLWDWE